MDFVYELEVGVLLLEYDEKMHSDRDKRCELVRQAEVSIGYGDMPVHWIRFNPDDFKVAGATVSITSNDREAVLLGLIQAAVGHVDYENLITIDYVCYDKPEPHKDDGTALVQTFKFKTIGAYSVWVNMVAPEKQGSSSGEGAGCP